MAITDLVQQNKEAALNRIALQNDAAAINRTQLALDSQLLAQSAQLQPLVWQLYLAYFGRPPTTEEAQQWFDPTPIAATEIINPTPGTNPLVQPATPPQGSTTPTGLYNYLGRGGNPELMAQTLGTDPEFYAHLGADPLATLYLRLFGRLPTSADRLYWQTQNPPLTLLPYRIVQTAGGQDAYWLNQKVALAQAITAELAAGLGQNDYPNATVDQPQIAAAIEWAIQRVGPNGKTVADALLDFRHLLDPTALTPLEKLNAPATQSEYQSTLANLFLAYLGRPIQMWDADTNPETPLGKGNELAALLDALARSNGDPTPIASYLFTLPQAHATLGATPEQAIATAYQNLFGRSPTTEETNTWLTRFSSLTPWEIASSPTRTPTDRAVQAERTTYLWYAGELLASKKLDAANPLHTAAVKTLLPQVGKGVAALDALYRLNIDHGAPKQGRAQIEEVFLSGKDKTLTLLFDEPMGWQQADRNGDSALTLGSEIQILVEGRYKEGPINGQGGGNWSSDTVPNPLGTNPKIAAFASTRLVIRLDDDSGLLTTRTLNVDHDDNPATPDVPRTDTPFPYRIMITGVPDATGEYGNIIWNAP